MRKTKDQKPSGDPSDNLAQFKDAFESVRKSQAAMREIAKTLSNDELNQAMIGSGLNGVSASKFLEAKTDEELLKLITGAMLAKGKS